MSIRSAVAAANPFRIGNKRVEPGFVARSMSRCILACDSSAPSPWPSFTSATHGREAHKLLYRAGVLKGRTLEIFREGAEHGNCVPIRIR